LLQQLGLGRRQLVKVGNARTIGDHPIDPLYLAFQRCDLSRYWGIVRLGCGRLRGWDGRQYGFGCAFHVLSAKRAPFLLAASLLERAERNAVLVRDLRQMGLALDIVALCLDPCFHRVLLQAGFGGCCDWCEHSSTSHFAGMGANDEFPRNTAS
jgi:hypothetical protein